MNPSERTGTALAVIGAGVSAIGTLVNCLALNHIQAMYIWALSNPVMLAYFIGHRQGKWNGNISDDAFIALYCIFNIANIYGLVKGA